MLRKAIRMADSLVNRVVSFVCLLLFLICLYAMIGAANVDLNANDTSILKYKPQLGETEEEPLVVENAVAWLTIDGTRIDYPLMQGETNYIYLNLDPFGNFSLAGSIFLDSRNSSDFSDPYSLVYGHHMEHGAMFDALDDFYDRTYFDQHRTGLLMVTGGQNYNIDFFACCKAQATEPLIFDPPQSNNDSLLDFLRQNALICDLQGIDADCRILALSTCQAADTLERLILFGALREIA